MERTTSRNRSRERRLLAYRAMFPCFGSAHANRPGGRNGADPMFDQHELKNIVVRDGSKITKGSKEAVFIREEVRDRVH